MPTRSYSYEFTLLDKVTAPVKKITGAFRNATKPVDKLKTKISSIEKPVKKVERSVVRFEKRVMRMPKMVGNAFSKVTNRLGGLSTTILGFLAFDRIRAFGGEVITTLSSFERMQAVLENLFGNRSAAQIVFRDISKFAKRTPFQVDKLTASWVKLANQGFTPNMKQMTRLGDLASSVGKDFDQLAEATIDAQVGEFERLKEFGIRAQKEGNKVKFTFKGVTTEVDFTAKSIQGYILGLGKLKGVQGSMNAIMGTTGGRLSNLTDKWTAYKNFLGNAFKPVINSTISLFSRTIDRLTVATQWVQKNSETIKMWGMEGLKLVGIITSMWAAARLFIGYQLLVGKITAAYTLLTSGITIAKVAQMAFNFVASLNPFGWIGLVVGGVVAIATNFGGLRDWLVKIGKFLWDNHPFKWLIHLIEKVFPSFGNVLNAFFGTIKSYFTKIWNWVHSNFIEPIEKFIKWLRGDDGSGTSSIREKSASEAPVTLAEARTSANPEINPYTLLNTGGKFQASNTKGGQSSKNPIRDGLASVSGGGNIKHININIQNLNEGGINVMTNKVEMSKAQLKSFFERLLLDVVNDVNYQ